MEKLIEVTNELDHTCGISDEELTKRFKESIRIDEEVRRIKGLPVDRYDDETKKHTLNIQMGGESMSENEKDRLPEIIVFTGSNGCRKSTITKMAEIARLL